MLPDDTNRPPISADPARRPEAQLPSVRLDYRPPPIRPAAANPKSGSIRLFKLLGITVFLHWSWFVVALYQIERRQQIYTSIAWGIAEYLSLFAIVLMHEFGHALACRSVGGRSERIVLWPLGGVAYVNPPPRAGALLWSIVAGPLVNVALFPLTWWLDSYCGAVGGNLATFAHELFWINSVLLVFNLLPIYPLDGGQILQALLWFVVGRAWSLMVAACIGMVGAAGILALAAWDWSIWTAALAVFAGSMAFRGIKLARMMLQLEKAPRRPGLACPHCGKNPQVSERWKCPCGNTFDTFATGGQCPRCGQVFNLTTCFDCGKTSPIAAWSTAPVSVTSHPGVFARSL